VTHSNSGVSKMKPDEIGSLLRVAREDRGLTIADAASVTKISKYHLSNMEKGEFSVLGARPYAIGYMKTYAKYLGLCEKHFCEMLREEYPQFKSLES
jgi:cytoskeleton protein RodZ